MAAYIEKAPQPVKKVIAALYLDLLHVSPDWRSRWDQRLKTLADDETNILAYFSFGIREVNHTTTITQDEDKRINGLVNAWGRRLLLFGPQRYPSQLIIPYKLRYRGFQSELPEGELEVWGLRSHALEWKGPVACGLGVPENRSRIVDELCYDDRRIFEIPSSESYAHLGQ